MNPDAAPSPSPARPPLASLLDEAIQELAAEASTMIVGEPVRLVGAMERSGDFIGRYQLLDQLGQGGFGIVWRAQQTEPIRREVALKVIKPGMDSREIIARFEAERQTLALMDHPHIAAVLDAGTTEQGRPYFAMELVKGIPITDYCDEHRLSIRQRVELFIPVCHAVQHAHQKAILHRDLKPSNILITEVDGRPVPKVIDFGIAKALGTSPEAALQASLLQTQAGAIIGTPQYMSPEQAGAAPDLDTRSDIYTLGVILYELLTGDTPLSRETLLQGGIQEVLRQIRETDPARPSSRVQPVTDIVRQSATTRRIQPEGLPRLLRGDLDWIVLKSLEKDRSRRYATAAALARDIERHLNNEPVEAGPPSAFYRLRKLARRNRLLFAAGTAVLACLFAGIIGTSLALSREQKAKQQVEQRDKENQKLLHEASSADHEAALRSFAERRAPEGIAYLERALRFAPDNTAALAATATHAFGPSAQGWRTRNTAFFDSDVHNLDFSPDGRFLAVALDQSVRVIEAATGKEVGRNSFDGGNLCFSPDGRYLAAGGFGKVARVIDASTGKEVASTGFGGSIKSVCFSTDGRLIAAGSEDRTARVIEAATGKEVLKIDFDARVNSVCLSPDSRFFAVGGDDKTARTFDTSTGKELYRTAFELGVERVAFSPDGRFLAAVSNFGSARIIEAATGKEVSVAKFGEELFSFSFSPDGRYLAFGSGDHTARVMETLTGKEVSRAVFGTGVFGVDFSPDGRLLAAGSWDNTARLIEAATGKEVFRAEFNGPVKTVRFSPDGRFVAMSGDKTVRIIEPNAGREVVKTQLGSWIECAGVSTDGRFIGVVCDDKTARIIEAANGKEVARTRLGERVSSVGVSPDGRFIAIGCDDRTACIVEAATGNPIHRTKFNFTITNLSFSPDGRYLAASGFDVPPRIIETATGKDVSGKEVASWQPSPMLSTGLDPHSIGPSFSPGKRFVAETVNLYNDTVRIVETDPGKEVCRVETEEMLNGVSFSSDGRSLAVIGRSSVSVIDATWLSAASETYHQAFKSALVITSGHQFHTDGRLVVPAVEDLLAAQAKVHDFLQSPPPPKARWQHDILRWVAMPPETRTTSPWTREPIREAAGRWKMEQPDNKTIIEEVPWHPLEPVYLARLESKYQRPDPRKEFTGKPTLGAIDKDAMLVRTRFLARLTLKRLREADEHLYSPDTLANYAFWTAKTLHQDLHLVPEALEALNFALERTPPDKQQKLLDLKTKLDTKR